jgi:hypothetical protein
MTHLPLCESNLRSFAANGRLAIARVRRRLNAAFRSIHRAIVTAKLRRLRQELELRRGFDAYHTTDKDALKCPQRPLILGDKWDF